MYAASVNGEGTVIYPQNGTSSDCPFPDSTNAKTAPRFALNGFLP